MTNLVKENLLETAGVKSTTVSQLKAHLSAFLRRTKAGEEIIVTERGKPVARIVPIGVGGTGLPEQLKEMERAGLIRLGSGRLPKRFWALARPDDPQGLVRQAVLAEREEGW